MKHFTVSKGYITPKSEDWYHITTHDLDHYYPDGQHHWFPHLAEKSWFTEEMFWELLEFSKKKFPNCNFDKAIFQASKAFAINYFYENESPI